MDVFSFLASQSWLCRVPSAAIDAVKNRLTFYTILKDAHFSLYHEDIPLDIPSTESRDLDLVVMIAVDQSDEFPPSLYFVTRDDYFLVNHTLMEAISFPRDKASRSGHPPCVLISWPQLKMRIAMSSTAALESQAAKLGSCVSSMSKVLQPKTINMDALLRSIEYYQQGDESLDALGAAIRESCDMIQHMSEILRPTISTSDAMKLLISTDTYHPTYPTSLPLEDVNECLSRAAKASLSSCDSVRIQRYLEHKQLAEESRLDELLGSLYPEKGSQTISPDDKVSSLCAYALY